MDTLVDRWAKAELEALAQRNLSRRLEPLQTAQGPRVSLGGTSLINFSSNDYLGLANHPELISTGQQALAQWGAGAGASRLVVGDLLPHASLERALAAFEGCEGSVVFSSGYAANVGAIGAVVKEGDVVFSDALNHASIVDGCRLSRAKVLVYRHSDLEHLEGLVKSTPARRRLVVTDSVFSMDGDRAPLLELSRLCARHELALMVDEAHATGVLGPTGAGLSELVQVKPDLHLGTLSKGLGCQGGWIAGSSLLSQLLINKARSFVFSTGLAPALCAMGEAAVGLVQREPERRARLWRNIHLMTGGLKELGFPVAADSAIFSVVLGTEERALAASSALRTRGFLVKAIRPPTVAPGTSRLRVSVSAAHEVEDVHALLNALAEVIQR